MACVPSIFRWGAICCPNTVLPLDRRLELRVVGNLRRPRVNPAGQVTEV